MAKAWLIFALLLPACKVVTPDEMRRAEAACKAHGGLVFFRADALPFQSVARCEDGTEIARLPERGRK